MSKFDNAIEKIARKANIKWSAKVLKLLLLALVALLGLFVALYINEQHNTAMVLVGMDIETRGYAVEGGYEQEQQAPAPIVVYISGEVQNPGVFTLDYGARIVDAIEAAGGMTDYADPNAINLAARLVDAQHIVVFSLTENAPPSGTAGAAGQAAGGQALVNINTATSEQLQTLSGIGPVMAGNIISHREARGGFAAIEEINECQRHWREDF